MADRIKGITVEINGDATGLSNALKGINSEITRTSSQLKDVNKLLKLDPGNTELLKQKQKLLADAIGETKAKLEKLKEAQEAAAKAFAEGKITEGQYDAIKREVAETEAKLRDLEQQALSANTALQKIGQAGEGLKDLGGKIEGAGKALAPVSAAAAAIGTASVKTAADFDAQMSKVQAISGATGKDIDALRDKAREMGAQTKFSASEAGQAMEYMAMAGWKTEDMLSGVAGIMDLAAASGEDLGTTSDIVTDALTAFGMSAQDSGHFADVMAAASSNANTNVRMLGESFKYVAPVAGALGYDVEDVAVALGLMANSGIKSSQAGTAMRSALSRLTKPTKQMREYMEKYDIAITKSDGSMMSLMEVMEMLRDKMGGLSEAEQAEAASAIFGQEAMSGWLAIINAGEGDFTKLSAAISNADGTAQQMAATMQDNLNGQLTILKSQLEEAAISIGEALIPKVKSAVSAVQEWVDWFNHLDQGTKELIATIGLIVAAAAPVLIVIGQVVTAIGAILTAISGVGAALAVLAGPAGWITLTAAALGGLAIAFATSNDEAERYGQKLGELSKAEEENKQKVEELHKAYENSKDIRETSIGQANREAEEQRNLWKELQNITDENGKIKEGYEERAQVIIGQLQEALGIEIGLTDGVIQKYGELEQSIDDVIEKKRAEAILTAYQDEYGEALKKSASAQAEYATAQQNAARTAADLKQKSDDLQAALDRQGAIQGEVNAHNVTALQENSQLIQTINELRPQVEALNEKYADQQNTLALAEEAYTGYQSVIANTEAIQAAIDGNGNLQDALLKAEVGFQTAETGTRESLQRQAETFRAQYEDMRKSAQEGTAGISQDTIEGYRKLAEDAEAELKKVGGDLANDITEGQKQGIEEGTEQIRGALTEQANTGIEGAKTAWGAHSPSTVSMEIGRDWNAGLALGIGESAQEVYTAVETVANGATAKLTETLTASQGQVTAYQASSSASWATWSAAVLAALNSAYAQMTATTTSGMQNIRTTIEAALTQIRSKWEEQWKAIEQKHEQEMQTIRDKNREGMTDIRTTVETEMTATADLHKQKMEEMKTATEEGMNAILESVKSKGAELKPALEAGVEPAVQYLKDLIPMGRKWGDDFMSNYIAAVRERLAELEEVCEEAADIVSDYLECSRPDKGPMHTYPIWGKDFMEGYAESIRSNEWRVIDQMAELAGKMQQTMTGESDGGRPFVVNTTSQTILDGKVLAETVNTELGVIL